MEVFIKKQHCRIQGDDRETEIEDNLQAIDCMVSNLRNMAVDMSAEISDQNEQLERITLKVNGGFGKSLNFQPQLQLLRT